MIEILPVKFLYQTFVTVTDKAIPITSEIGEDLDARAVNVLNPRYIVGGAEDDAQDYDVYTGDRFAQFELLNPGGSTGVFGVGKLSDVWARARTAGTSVRLVINVYGDIDG